MGKDAAGAASDEETDRNIYIFRHIVRVGCIGYGAAFPDTRSDVNLTLGFKMPLDKSSIITTFLRSVAENNGYRVFNDIFGTIDLTAALPITQSSGAVYGIWAKAPSPLLVGLKPLPDYPEWFPVYWGKDITPVSRMKAHVKGHANGNINLPSVQEIQGNTLIFGAILVEKYQEFETLLHNHYPPMLGSSRPGKKSTVVRIAEET